MIKNAIIATLLFSMCAITSAYNRKAEQLQDAQTLLNRYIDAYRIAQKQIILLDSDCEASRIKQAFYMVSHD